MVDQHNANIPALANQVAEDIPDIKENLEFHKDALQRIFETWSDSDNSSQKIDSAVGFNDGTYNYEFPTNGVGAHSVFMLGTSATIVWMYLNAAPPGWKVLATGADMVLGVSGGAAAFNVNGGNPDSAATWTISGLTKDAHTHTVAAHNHTLTAGTQLGTACLFHKNIGTTSGEGVGGVLSAYDSSGGGTTVNRMTGTATTNSSANSGAQSSSGVTSSGAWRPKASIGKLFQLDTA